MSVNVRNAQPKTEPSDTGSAVVLGRVGGVSTAWSRLGRIVYPRLDHSADHSGIAVDGVFANTEALLVKMAAEILARDLELIEINAEQTHRARAQLSSALEKELAKRASLHDSKVRDGAAEQLIKADRLLDKAAFALRLLLDEKSLNGLEAFAARCRELGWRLESDEARRAFALRERGAPDGPEVDGNQQVRDLLAELLDCDLAAPWVRLQSSDEPAASWAAKHIALANQVRHQRLRKNGEERNAREEIVLALREGQLPFPGDVAAVLRQHGLQRAWQALLQDLADRWPQPQPHSPISVRTKSVLDGLDAMRGWPLTLSVWGVDNLHTLVSDPHRLPWTGPDLALLKARSPAVRDLDHLEPFLRNASFPLSSGQPRPTA